MFSPSAGSIHLLQILLPRNEQPEPYTCPAEAEQSPKDWIMRFTPDCFDQRHRSCPPGFDSIARIDLLLRLDGDSRGADRMIMPRGDDLGCVGGVVEHHSLARQKDEA